MKTETLKEVEKFILTADDIRDLLDRRNGYLEDIKTLKKAKSFSSVETQKAFDVSIVSLQDKIQEIENQIEGIIVNWE